MTKVLITCAYGNYFDMEVDKGNLGLIISTVGALREVILDVEVVTLWQLSEGFSIRHGIRLVPNKRLRIKPFSLNTSVKSSLDLFRSALWSMLWKRFNWNIKALINNNRLKERADADVIIDLSMDLWSEAYGLRTIIEHAKDVLTSVFSGKPVVMYAQTLGPFRKKVSRYLAKVVLNRVSLITLREEVSRGYLEEIGVNKTPIQVTAEPAFRLEAAPVGRIEEIFLNEGIDKERKPIIGVTWMSVGVRRPSGKKAKFVNNVIQPAYSFLRWLLPERLFQSLSGFLGRSFLASGIRSEHFRLGTLKEVVNHLTEELKATVIVVPHTSTPGIMGRELIIARELQPVLKHNERVKFISAEYTAEEMKGIIGQCDLFVGSKMHASIAALSQCVPTVLIPYSHKFYAAVGLLGQGKLLCDSVEIGDLTAKINEVWAHRYEVRRELESKVEIAKEQALLNAKLVKGLLDSTA